MAITINGIVCQELVEGFQEEVDLIAGPAARKGFLCDWPDRYTVANGLLGLTHSATIGGLITVNYPAQYPQISTIYAAHITFEPRGSPTQGTAQIQWPKCVVWVDYARLPFFANGFNQIDPAQPLAYAEQRLSASCEWVVIPEKFTKWKTTPTLPTKQDGGFRLALVEMEIRFPQMPYMPSDEVLTSAGMINNAPFLGVDTGKLMFNGVTTQTTALYDGSYTQEGAYSFTARSQRWDYAFNGNIPGWDQLVWPDGSTPFITSTDFTPILPNYTVV